MDGVSRGRRALGARATTLDSLMERCPSNCPSVIFCNRKQFRAATCVSNTGTRLPASGDAQPASAAAGPGRASQRRIKTFVGQGTFYAGQVS